MTPADRAALEIGRLFMRAHAAEQQAAALAERVAVLEEQANQNAEPETTEGARQWQPA